MIDSTSTRPGSSDNEMASSPEVGSRGFVAVNHASNNESSSSSQLSSPQEIHRRGSDGSSHTRASVLTPQQNDDASHHKRKRSQSGEASPYAYSPSAPTEPQHMANRALCVLGAEAAINSDQELRAWQPERQQSTVTKDSFGGIFQRGASAEVTPSRPWDLQPKTNEQLNQDQDGHDSSPGITQIGPKRKRNFSNRTKTGCMTCRQRKKKCDEAHPICNNCTRGGFQCQGYNMTRRIWPLRPPQVKAHLPLQAKDEKGDVSEPAVFPGRELDSPVSNNTAMQYEGGQGRPVTLHDQDNSRPLTLSPSEGAGRPSYTDHQPWPPPPPPPQQQQSNTYNADRLPPLVESNRSEPSPNVHHRDLPRPSTQNSAIPRHPQLPFQGPPQPASHLTAGAPGPNMSQPPPPPPPQQQPQPQQQQQPGSWQRPNRPGFPPAPPEQHQPSPAHGRTGSMSLDIRPGSKHFGKEDVERSKMMRGSEYKHFDPTLRYERQRCERAVNRYAAACQLDSGISEQEIRSLLMKIIDPSRDTTHKVPSNYEMKGYLGLGVELEVPFTCSYGYNLRLQEDVHIGKGCIFEDAAPIDVGPRSVIGPGVRIMTTEVARDSLNRKGPSCTWISKPVTILSEVIIGAGSLIYPGVTLGRGCTVEPGSIVRETLADYSIYRPSPGERFDLSREAHPLR